jgi:filamentous hemagglutinin family protein
VLDGSFGTSGALSGPNYFITAGMGRQIGPNLFQSFSQFNLTSGDSATFTAAGSTGPISNIIARVTGGPASIDGTVNSTIAGANLFFLDPAGVMFGPHAQVNVTGAFVVGTADYVRLADGGRFNAKLGDDSQLTSAEVSAFGFLPGATPQPVTFAGTQLSIPTGLHVVAGGITLDQGSADGTTERGTTLAAPSGNLTLFSAASAGEVAFSLASPGSGFAGATNTSFGAITLRHDSSANIDGAGGGRLVIRSGKLVVDGSTVTSRTLGGVAGGDISVQASSLSVTNGSFIGTDSELGATAPAGSVAVQVSGNATLSGTGSQISADTETASDGGTINVNVGGALTLTEGGSILATTDSAGRGGTVEIHAGSLAMGADSDVSTNTAFTGAAGSIQVDVAGSMDMSGNAIVSAGTFDLGEGGDVRVQAHTLDMTGKSTISSDTENLGNGGTVTVNADQLFIRGEGALFAAFGFRIGITGITAESLGLGGNAGSVTVDAPTLGLAGGAVISTASFSAGRGGTTTVSCADGSLTDQSEISSTSLTQAGTVSLTATDSFTISNDSSITTSAGRNGGNINLKVGRLLYLFDSNIQGYAGLRSFPGEVVGGNGGNITIDPEFVVLDHSFISANDLAPGGLDGNIVNLADFFFTSQSFLHATGTIETTTPDLDLGQKLIAAAIDPIDPRNRLRESCAAAIKHEFSSLVVVGRNGTENGPDELQPDFGVSEDMPAR